VSMARSPAQVSVLDFDAPGHNDWLAVNQFTVAEGQHTRRTDVVLFVNSLALAVVELENPADENATVWSAFQQLQTHQAQASASTATHRTSRRRRRRLSWSRRRCSRRSGQRLEVGSVPGLVEIAGQASGTSARLLLDDCVRPRQYRGRDRQPERLRGLEVDD
jgi:hypothetical protein